MNEHEQDTLGKALGRAVEAQPVRETRFAGSRLAAEIDRPAGAMLPIFRLAAALAVVALVALGLYASQLQPRLPAAASPSPVGPSATAVPTTGPGPVRSIVDHSVAYCWRADAPPYAVKVSGIDGATPDQRVLQRLRALEGSGVATTSCQLDFRIHAASASIRGDRVTVDYTIAAGAIGRKISFADDPLIQQIVYTATEEPGIRSVLLTENGGAQADLGGLVLRDPLTRESTLGYRAQPASSFATPIGTGGWRGQVASTRSSVDEVAPGLTRFTIELASGGTTAGDPAVDIRLTANTDEVNDQDHAKWKLEITVPGVKAEQRLFDTSAGNDSNSNWVTRQIVPVNKTPLRSVDSIIEAHMTGAEYVLALDDARPWRVFSLQNPSRIVVDIGGPTAWTSTQLAVYSAELSGHNVHVTGLANAFEANVPWRVKDASGRIVAQGSTTASLGTSQFWGAFDTTVAIPASVSGNVTLEVYEVSPKDGATTDLVGILLTVR